MNAIKLSNGNLLIPKIAETGEVIGDGMIEITPKDKRYKEWLPFAIDETPYIKAAVVDKYIYE